MPILKMPGWSKEQVDDAFDELAEKLGVRSPTGRNQNDQQDDEDEDYGQIEIVSIRLPERKGGTQK